MKLKEKIAFRHGPPPYVSSDIIQAFLDGWDACRKTLLKTVEPLSGTAIVMPIDQLKTFGDEDIPD